MPSFLISAGEASGEAYGAELISAIRAILPEAQFFGLGGERMRAAGCETVVDTRDVAVLGLTEVISHLPGIYRQFRRLLSETDARRPAAAILIDFPDFNFRLARKLHARGIPVFYYVSPQLWAWRPRRVELVRKYVRKMLVIFPFEEKFYRDRGVDVAYVGHPLADIQPPTVSRDNFAAANGLEPNKQWIALLPGSRRKEVAMNLPEILRAAESLGNRFDFAIPVAPTLDRDWLNAMMVNLTGSSNARVRLTNDPRATLAHSRAAVVASGTATVEAALIGTPFVVVYRVAGLTWSLGRHLVNVPHYAMVNLIAGREVVPELIQHRFTGEIVAGEIRKIVADGLPRETMIRDMAEVRGRLNRARDCGSASQQAAETIFKELHWDRTGHLQLH